MQVAHARIAAGLERGVEVRDQCAQAQPLRLIAADQHAVRAFVGHHLHGGALGSGGSLVERVDHAHHFGSGRVGERHDLDVLVADLVDAPDDFHHAVHVAGAVGDDEDVRGRVGHQVAVLRDHRPQDRHQLRRGDVLDIHHLRDDLVRGGTHVVGQVERGHLPRIGIGQDLHHVPGGHGDEAVHLQDREERLVEGGRRHGGRRQHGHLRAYARVDDEGLAGRSAHRFRDLRDVRVLEVGRDALRLRRRLQLRRLLRLLRRRERGGHDDRERAHCKRTKACLH